jgi:hypothetical protein
MKGYLLKEQAFSPGEDTFVESSSSENSYAVIFEDDAETGYFYALEVNKDTGEQKILDALHIYESATAPGKGKSAVVKIIWSTDWLRCALVINNYCHAAFDFQNQGGYNRNEFPPPNEIWTKGERKLTDEMVEQLFK